MLHIFSGGFFCASAWQLTGEGFPCFLCQGNKCHWATGVKVPCGRGRFLQDFVFSLAATLFQSGAWRRCCYTTRGRTERQQDRMCIVWSFAGLLLLLCAPSQVRWLLGLGRMHIWGQGTGYTGREYLEGPGLRNSISWAQEELGRVPARSAGAQAERSCILDKWGMGRRKVCGLPPQGCCGQLVSSKVEGMGQGWQEERGLCRGSRCSNCLPGSSVMFSKLWASPATCEMWSGFSNSSTSYFYPSI